MQRDACESMSSGVLSEKPKAQVVAEVARVLADCRDSGRSVTAVFGPAVVHTGAARALARTVGIVTDVGLYLKRPPNELTGVLGG
jgi:hypothetical protein